MKKASNLTRWAILSALFLCGAIAFIFIAGEENPNGLPESWLKFFAHKAIGLAIFILCFIAGKYLNKKGLLPDVEE